MTDVTPAPADNTEPTINPTGPNDTTPKISFPARAAKAVWGFIAALIGGLLTSIMPILLAGNLPTSQEWITAVAVGLVTSLGVGTTVYHVKNTDAVG